MFFMYLCCAFVIFCAMVVLIPVLATRKVFVLLCK
jgi:hypothetical protein